MPTIGDTMNMTKRGNFKISKAKSKTTLHSQQLAKSQNQPNFVQDKHPFLVSFPPHFSRSFSNTLRRLRRRRLTHDPHLLPRHFPASRVPTDSRGIQCANVLITAALICCQRAFLCAKISFYRFQRISESLRTYHSSRHTASLPCCPRIESRFRAHVGILCGAWNDRSI